jgi:hypothetical protein
MVAGLGPLFLRLDLSSGTLDLPRAIWYGGLTNVPSIASLLEVFQVFCLDGLTQRRRPSR